MKQKNYNLNVCIIGGGNVGTLLAGEIGSNEEVNVNVLTSKASLWGKFIEIYDSEDNLQKVGKINLVSSNPEEVIPNSEIIISTLPSNIAHKKMPELFKYMNPGTKLGFMPGSGGKEFYSRELLNKGITIFGFQRVSAISRIKKLGKSVYNLGKKKELYISAIPKEDSKNIANMIEKLLNIKTSIVPNYLNITLTPSNPILHTTRLYSILKNNNNNLCFKKEIYFYKEWDDDSSRELLLCDNELEKILNKLRNININVSGIIPLKKYYEHSIAEKLTKKN